ncbi:MAG: hypothetical protein HUU57_14090 [Bdellovibrio sp.]|nr:hypothetical protein [Bdellovibrio sp.]
MNSIFNQYSYLFIAVGVILGALVVLRILRVKWRFTVPMLLLAALALGGCSAVRLGYNNAQPGRFFIKRPRSKKEIERGPVCDGARHL